MAAAIENQCRLLDKEFYPVVDSVLESAILLCVDPDVDPDLQLQSLLVFRIRNEFESLAYFERKLVFQAFVNAARKLEHAANIPGNITELVRLIQFKDQKILEYINTFESSLLENYPPIREMADCFRHLFEVEKKKLYELISKIASFAGSATTILHSSPENKPGYDNGN